MKLSKLNGSRIIYIEMNVYVYLDIATSVKDKIYEPIAKIIKNDMHFNIFYHLRDSVMFGDVDKWRIKVMIDDSITRQFKGASYK